VSMSIQSLGCGHDSNDVDLQDLAMTYDGWQNLCTHKSLYMLWTVVCRNSRSEMDCWINGLPKLVSMSVIGLALERC
jgi:hypothetical protein